jgi:hypothetical protein
MSQLPAPNGFAEMVVGSMRFLDQILSDRSRVGDLDDPLAPAFVGSVP